MFDSRWRRSHLRFSSHSLEIYATKEHTLRSYPSILYFSHFQWRLLEYTWINKVSLFPPLYALIRLTTSCSLVKLWLLPQRLSPLSIKSMSPRCCANISYSHLKHIIGPWFNIPKNHLIDRILLRNIPDILKDNSVLRMVRDKASHLMFASFFNFSRACVCYPRWVNSGTSIVLPLWQETLRRRLPLASRVQTHEDLHPERRRLIFTISKVYCFKSPCKRTNSHCIIFD